MSCFLICIADLQDTGIALSYWFGRGCADESFRECRYGRSYKDGFASLNPFLHEPFPSHMWHYIRGVPRRRENVFGGLSGGTCSFSASLLTTSALSRPIVLEHRPAPQRLKLVKRIDPLARLFRKERDQGAQVAEPVLRLARWIMARPSSCSKSSDNPQLRSRWPLNAYLSQQRSS